MRLAVEYVRPQDLRFFENNPRQITDEGLKKLQTSLHTFGFANPILAQKGTNVVIAGNQRLKAAIAAGLKEVPVIFLDFDDAAAKAYNIADNRLQEESTWHKELLAELLAELQAVDFDLALTGFDDLELERLIGEVPEPPDESEIDLPAEGEAEAKPGQLWQLGRHFLLCGDSTDEEAMRRFLAPFGGRVELLFTSPPYPGADMWEEDDEALVAVGNAVIEQAPALLKEGGVLVWNTCDIPRGNSGYVCNVARDTMTAVALGLKKRAEIIWYKGLTHMPMHGAQRRPVIANLTHETLLVFFNGDWKPREKKGALNPKETEWSFTSIWTVAAESATKIGHKAPFPVELAQRVISLWTLPGDVVLDPFVGSGTTIIAAEQLGRTGLGVEINPVYVDLAIRRWESLTGEKAVLVGGEGAP